MTEKKILAFERPDLLKEWDYEKNKNICAPDDVTIGSGKKVWWICPKGHSYDAIIYSRTKINSGCPICAGKVALPGWNDLKTSNPELLIDWDYEKNDIDPTSVTAGSEKRVWWKCHNCGFEWQSTVSNRAKAGRGCRKCAAKERGRLKTIQASEGGKNSIAQKASHLLDEWNYDKNNGIDPNYIAPNYSKKVWWKCSICGNEWLATPNHRMNGRGCPRCTAALHTSFPEQIIYYYLKKTFPNTINSYHPSFLSGKEIDIYIPELNLAIEYDGRAWHKNLARDVSKSEEILNNGLSLIRVREPGCPPIHIEGMKVINGISADKMSSGVIYPTLKELFGFINAEYKQSIRLDFDLEDDIPLIIKEYNWSIKENSLETKSPELAKEWDYTKNKGLKPTQVFPGSQRKVWWICGTCGYSWNASIASRVSGSGCPACSNQVVYNGNDLESMYPELALEWNYDRNTISPSEVVFGSNKKVWWKCSTCGFEWKAIIQSRTRMHTGCPACAGKTVIPGYNDLATKHPELLREWDYEKNTDLEPTQVTSGSKKKVWWKCSTCGNSWQSAISNRVKGNGCPECARKAISKAASAQNLVVGTNDLATLYPELLEEWDYEKNTVSPNQVSCGSAKRVWWKCSTCGNSWQTSINHRTMGKTGCPECAKAKRVANYQKTYIEKHTSSLRDRSPELLQDWDYRKNNQTDPSNVSFGSSQLVWWKCHQCGFEWQATVQSRTQGSQCPNCRKKDSHGKAIKKFLIPGVNDLATLYPSLVEEWDYEKNADDPHSVTAGSGLKVGWICKKCGNRWTAIIGNRTRQNAGCPECAKAKMGPRKKE